MIVTICERGETLEIIPPKNRNKNEIVKIKLNLDKVSDIISDIISYYDKDYSNCSPTFGLPTFLLFNLPGTKVDNFLLEIYDNNRRFSEWFHIALDADVNKERNYGEDDGVLMTIRKIELGNLSISINQILYSGQKDDEFICSLIRPKRTYVRFDDKINCLMKLNIDKETNLVTASILSRMNDEELDSFIIKNEENIHLCELECECHGQNSLEKSFKYSYHDQNSYTSAENKPYLLKRLTEKEKQKGVKEEKFILNNHYNRLVRDQIYSYSSLEKSETIFKRTMIVDSDREITENKVQVDVSAVSNDCSYFSEIEFLTWDYKDKLLAKLTCHTRDYCQAKFALILIDFWREDYEVLIRDVEIIDDTNSKYSSEFLDAAKCENNSCAINSCKYNFDFWELVKKILVSENNILPDLANIIIRF
jgi:hypothetical protein